MSEAITAAAGAGGLVAGATPFGWASLAAGFLSGGAGGAPAAPNVATSGIGGTLLNLDNSGWTVATSGSTATAKAGDRGGLSGGSGTSQDTIPYGYLVAGLVAVAIVILAKRK